MLMKKEDTNEEDERERESVCVCVCVRKRVCRVQRNAYATEERARWRRVLAHTRFVASGEEESGRRRGDKRVNWMSMQEQQQLQSLESVNQRASLLSVVVG
jgi:hypothetical protein